MSININQHSIARISECPQTLNTIQETDVSIAIWQRSALSNMLGLKLDNIIDARFTADISELADTLDDAMNEAGYERNSARDILHMDVLMLANRFVNIMKTNKVEIRLKHVSTDSCRKFHSDYVTARLITTYLGQGTQWLDSDDAENRDDPKNIQHMLAGEVGLFKGNAWSKDNPAIHRSPPIEITGEERLMLVINPA